MKGNTSMDAQAKQQIGIIINIPFTSKERKGDTVSHAGLSPEVRTDYLKVLSKELESANDILEGREIAFLNIKGSAAMVPPDDLSRLVRNLRKRYVFAEHAEVTIEMTPETIGTPSLTALNVCKFTLPYLRIISSDEAVLKAVGDPWSVDSVVNALAFFEKFGYMRPALELMYGIPGMTVADVRTHVDLLTRSTQIKQVCLTPYELAAEQDVSTAELTAQYEAATRLLAQRKFVPYAAGRLARANGRDRSFISRCNGAEYVGVGLGAISYVDGFISRNTDDVATYLASDGNYTKLIVSATELTESDRAALELWGALQLSDGISNDRLDALLEEVPDLSEKLTDLVAEDLLEFTDDRLVITSKGCVQTNVIADRLNVASLI